MEEKYLLLNEHRQLEVLSYLPDAQQSTKLAEYFSIFSDATRLKIISCLAMCDMCVNDLSTILKINQTTISHQLKYLKSEKIIASKRRGKIIVYSLVSQHTNEVMLTGVNAI